MRTSLMIFLGSFLCLTFFTATPSYACACGIATFSSEQTIVESDGTARAFLSWNEGSEHYVIDPGLRGTAQDFGMVAAFPSRPEINRAPDNLFQELFDYTKPLPSQRSGSDGTGYFGSVGATAPQSTVTVVEVKEVGDFTASVLTATDSISLAQWLRDNNYKTHDSDLENFNYYVQRGGYYFVALKLTTHTQSEEKSEYKLTPLEFIFSSPTPFVPLRLVRGTTKHQVRFSLYTASQKPLIVKGAGLVYSNLVSEQLPRELSSLERYGVEKKWLLKLNMLIDPTLIQDDLTLGEWTQPKPLQLHEGDVPLLLFQNETQNKSGVLQVADARELIFTHTLSGPSYTHTSKKSFFAEYGWLLLFLFFILLYLYKSTVLFLLGKKLNTRHTWLAWIPLIHFFFLFLLAKKPRYCIGFCGAIIGFFVFILVSGFLRELIPYYSNTYYICAAYITLSVIFIEYTLLERTLSAIAVLRGRPAWWGICSLLVPPVGIILFGILAWSDKKDFAQTSQQTQLQTPPPSLPETCTQEILSLPPKKLRPSTKKKVTKKNSKKSPIP